MGQDVGALTVKTYLTQMFCQRLKICSQREKNSESESESEQVIYTCDRQ